MKIARRLVETPEMLRLVCELSEASDQVKFSCASRLFFGIAAPVIWGSVVGAHNLLALLPGVKTGTNESDSMERLVVSECYSVCKT